MILTLVVIVTDYNDHTFVIYYNDLIVLVMICYECFYHFLGFVITWIVLGWFLSLVWLIVCFLSGKLSFGYA